MRGARRRGPAAQWIVSPESGGRITAMSTHGPGMGEHPSLPATTITRPLSGPIRPTRNGFLIAPVLPFTALET